jgi:hypothetical protein
LLGGHARKRSKPVWVSSSGSRLNGGRSHHELCYLF